MTEASENAYLVRVRAQVMCRDEGTGGWVALGGGGLADVMVGKRVRIVPPGPSPKSSPNAGPSQNGDNGASRLRAENGNGEAPPAAPAAPPAPTHEYFIHGRRISDNMVVLECTIKKDFQYNKVMPTFHHWVTDEKRFGLTFQTAADARAFDKGVRSAIEELLDGLGGAWPSLHAYKHHNPAPKEEDEEQNIFECLNLPSESQSSSAAAAAAGSSSPGRARRSLSQTPILSAITLPAHHSHPLQDPLKFDSQFDDKLEDSDADRPSNYVQLHAVHEYQYPALGAVISSEKSSPNTKPPLLKRDSGSVKKCGYSSSPPPLPDKKPAESFQARIKCRHCHEWYLESANRAGACEFAPDCLRSCIDAVSCIKCAQCMLYHCMSDAEGDFAMHPCACGPPDENCAKRWAGVTLLSLLVPCLCCYLPLRGARRCARAAGAAGGAHAPALPPPTLRHLPAK